MVARRSADSTRAVSVSPTCSVPAVVIRGPTSPGTAAYVDSTLGDLLAPQVQAPRVADLTARLGVERRLVEHQFGPDVLRNGIDQLAVDDQAAHDGASCSVPS